LGHNNISEVNVVIDLDNPLTPDEIAKVITSVGNLAMNRSQIRADNVELTITRAPVSSAALQEAQRLIDAQTSRLTAATSDLKSTIDKEKEQ